MRAIGHHLDAHPDLWLVSGLGAVALLLVVPVPPWVLDLLLAGNVAFALVIFVAVVFSDRPLALSSFPSLLLMTTLARLALNVSSTRLILSQARGSSMVEAFGSFVVRGDVVLGLVVFAVLTLIQLVVVGKGAERVAEVGARFTLDALPGRQMSIDAALRSGSLTEAQASAARRDLQRESQFYGAMDGAMKFVKGDAVAGLLITALDLVVGVGVGVGRHGLSWVDAMDRFGLLTVGDGLVAQVPALFVTLAAGMLTTRVASDHPGHDLGRTLQQEILQNARVLLTGAVFAACLGLVPGLPTAPFLLVAGILAARGWTVRRVELRARQPERDFERVLRAKTEAAHAQRGWVDRVSPGVSLLGIDLDPHLTRALGVAPDEAASSELVAELIPQLRQALYVETGVKLPGVRIRSDQRELSRGSFRILVREVPVEEGWLSDERALVCAPPERVARFVDGGQPGTHPVHGQPATWVDETRRPVLVEAGLTAWSPSGVLALHLARAARRHLSSFVGVQETAELVEGLETSLPALVREVVPAVLGLPQLAEVLRSLVAEQVSIRDLRAILDALADGPGSSDPALLTERARAALSLHLAAQCAPLGRLDAILIEPAVEEAVRRSLHVTEAGAFLALDPAVRLRLVDEIRRLTRPPSASPPVLLTQTELRRSVKRLLDPAVPGLAVLSFQELPPQLVVHTRGRVEAARVLEHEAGLLAPPDSAADPPPEPNRVVPAGAAGGVPAS
jgi:type III secretion protein V